MLQQDSLSIHIDLHILFFHIYIYGDGESDLHSYTCMYIQDSSGQEFFIVFALYSGLGVLNDPRDRTISFLNS